MQHGTSMEIIATGCGRSEGLDTSWQRGVSVAVEHGSNRHHL